MRKLLGITLLALLITMLTALVGGTVLVAEDTDQTSEAKESFLAQKCNSCHSVPTAGIEAKTKSKTMRGPDLPTDNDAERDALIKYIRKEEELDGKKHKKASKATDDELNVILDWLATQAGPESE